MAVVRLHPTKSNTLYSSNVYLNAGRDQIIELTSDKLDISRILLGFDFSTVSDIFDAMEGEWTANLILYMANASNLPEIYTVKALNIFSDWNEGTGNYLNIPITSESSTWKYSNVGSNLEWNTTGGAIMSYNPSTVGGGNWYSTPESESDINKHSSNELVIDVTENISKIYYDSLGTGILLKLDTIHESNYNESINVKYFSEDTNTIYKPVLEIRYNDSINGQEGNNPLINFDVSVAILNGFSTLSLDDVVRFNVGIKNLFHQKSYTTLYSPIKSLNIPSSSYWQLKDVNTGEIIIKGSPTSTTISNVGDLNYFDFNTKNLYRNRYYSFDIFIIMGSLTKKFTPKYIFNIK